MEAETWRSRVVQPPPQPAPQQLPPLPPSASLPLLEQMDPFCVDVDENVEVVDFSEHGKLIGVTTSESTSLPPEDADTLPHNPARPRAADFFQDDDAREKVQPATMSKADEEVSWRRKVSPAQESPPVLEQIPEKPKLQISPTLYHATPASPYRKSAPMHFEEQGRPKEQASLQGHPQLKSPLMPAYREAPMAALNDSMARIKGALDDMHHPPPPQKWLPPALRLHSTRTEKSPQREHDEHLVREVFDVTSYEPPRSPKPAWNHFAVKLSRSSTRREPVPVKRLRGFVAAPYARLDILSLMPHGGKRAHQLQLNDFLFPRPPFVKGRPEYRVCIPKPSRLRVVENGLVVNLPAPARSSKPSDAGAFGRPREADGVASWRKPNVSSSHKEEEPGEGINGLKTISRSPPPEPPRTQLSSSPLLTYPKVSVPATKAKPQPKVPEGSAVAFYRGAHVESSDRVASSAVRFIVSSELEDETPSNLVIGIEKSMPLELLPPAVNGGSESSPVLIEPKSEVWSPQFPCLSIHC